MSLRGHIPALDGIRGLAILMVLGWHGFFEMFAVQPAGSRFYLLGRSGLFLWSGVDLFFVLSGFLICGILLDVSGSPSYFRTFYLRRAYRILPLYFALLAFASLAALCYYGLPKPEWLSPYVGSIYYPVFLQNVWMAVHGKFGSLLLAPTWSLAVEEQFYLTLPLIIYFVSRRSLTRILLATIAIAPLLRIFARAHFPDGKIAAYVLMPCRADALAMGALAALAVRSPEAWKRLTEYKLWIFAGIGVIGAVLIAILHSGYEVYTKKLFGLEYSLLDVFYLLILLSALLSPQVGSALSARWLRYLGSIAYGTYLIQGLITYLRDAFTGDSSQHPGARIILVSVIAILLSVGLASLSWNYFERPLVRRGHRVAY
ncbi:MAG: acyltransferase [Candidatus Sulfotelmatobacter sp.]